MSRPLRIAFLFPECIVESWAGTATYINRITRVLQQMGHEPEVFTSKGSRPGVIDFYGIRVEQVGVTRIFAQGWLEKLARIHPVLDATEVFEDVVEAWRMARALAARERERPFDLVQCSNWGANSLFVSKRAGRPIVTRCAQALDLYLTAEGKRWTIGDRLLTVVECLSVSRADVAYAPSRFIADHMNRNHRMRVEVLRPPLYLEVEPADQVPEGLPPRYLIHFGMMGRRKGTDLIAEALPLVWQKEPDFAMVWAGFEGPEPVIERYQRDWGKFVDQVKWLGQIRKHVLYAILKRAEATVVPSRCDNLPNAAIESLLFGVPVIGSRGSSLDELVEPGVCGDLVSIGDASGLAEAMIRVWRGELRWNGPPAILGEMVPEVAASGLLRLAGLDPQRPDTRQPRGSAAEGEGPGASIAVRAAKASPAPLILRKLDPAATRMGQGFNVQPNGQSALSVICENAGFWTDILVDGQALATTYGEKTWLTALVPQALVAQPGRHTVQLGDPFFGVSNQLEFLVEPSAEGVDPPGNDHKAAPQVDNAWDG